MESSFDRFIVEYTKRITLELNASRAAIASPASQPDVPEMTAAPARRPAIELAVSSAASHSDNAIVFPDIAASMEAYWCIFVRETIQRDPVYKFRNKISLDQQPNEFVRESYENILMRPADPGGEAAYVSRIEAREWSLRDVLSTMANSAEAVATGFAFLIIPYPSSWTTAIGFQPDDTEVPDLSIKF